MQDPEPSIYVYSQRFRVLGESTQLERNGFIALGRIEDYSANVVFRHEQTLAKPKADRLELLRATKAHFGQIFMLYDDTGEIDNLLSPAGPPDTEVQDEYEVEHRMWRVSDPQLIALLRGKMADKKLIIADGHHRAASAARARTELGAMPGGSGDEADASTFIAVAFPDNQVDILPYNRTVKDLGGRTPERFLEDIRTRVPVTPGVPTPNRQGDVSMYVAGRWHTLAPVGGTSCGLV